MPIVSVPVYQVGLTGGASDRLIQGTNRSRPGGVESVFEFNGSLLNVRDWFDTYVITSISGTGDPDIRDSREVNPGRDGETYFNAYYGGRTIVLSGYIRAYSLAKLRDLQQGLKQAFADLAQEQPLYIRTGNVEKDVFLYCKKSAPLVMDEVQVGFDYRREFQITLRASNPRFLSYIEQRINYTDGWSELTAPTIPATVAGNNLAPNGRANNPVGGVTPGPDGWAFTYASAPTTVITAALANRPVIVPPTDPKFPAGRAFNIEGTTPATVPMSGLDPPVGGPNLARDAFDQTAGALVGKTLPVGGTWSGAGDSDDFSIDATAHTLLRNNPSTDNTTAIQFGRFAIAGSTTYSNIVVQVDTAWDSAYSGYAGVFARYIDTDNWLAAVLSPNSLGSNRTELIVFKRVAGVTAQIARAEFGVINPNIMHSVRLGADDAGNVWADCFVPGSSAGLPLLTSGHSDLAIGGPLASGKIGILNYCIGPPTLPIRTYDNFGAWLPGGPGPSPVYAWFEHTRSGSAAIPIVGGETYRWAVSFVPASHAYVAGVGPVNYLMGIEFHGPSGAFSSTLWNQALTTSGGVITTTATAPVGATGAKLLIAVPLGPSRAFNFYIGDSMLTRVAEYVGDFFDGETANSIWTGTRYLSSSRLYANNGLEGRYLFDSPSEYKWFVDSDGWIKQIGGNTGTSVRQTYRSDQVRVFTDLQATIKIRTGTAVGQTITGTPNQPIGSIGHVMKRKSATDFLAFRLLASGTNSRLQFYKHTAAGGEVQLAQSGIFNLAATSIYWIRGRIQGNSMAVELFTTDPILLGLPAQTLSATLAGVDATNFGAGVVGGFGVRSTLDVFGMDWWWRDHDIDRVSTEAIVAFNAANDGNAPAQPIFKVHGPVSALTSAGNAVRVGTVRVQNDGSTVTQNMIINAKTGSTLAIPSGNYIEVDTDKRTLKEFTSAGAFVRNSFDQLDIQSDWMELDPGDNPVEVQNYAIGTSPTLEMRYRHTYF